MSPQPLPSIERLFLASWMVQSPSSVPKLQQMSTPPEGFWIDVCLRAIGWAQAGLTEEQLQQELAKAQAEYEAHWANLGQRFPRRRPSLARADKQQLTAALLEDL